MKQEKLTTKQMRSCEEYAVDFNGTQAAIRAGYKEDNANIIASQNLTKLNVRNQIEKLTTEKSIRTEITADKVIQGIADIAFAEKDVANRDKLRALEMLGKHFCLFEKADEKFTKIIEQSVSVEVPSEVPEHIRQIFDMMRPILPLKILIRYSSRFSAQNQKKGEWGLGWISYSNSLLNVADWGENHLFSRTSTKNSKFFRKI